MNGPAFPLGGLVVLGPEYAADGHAVILNPTPFDRCSFAAGDVRVWSSAADVMGGCCGRDATHVLTPGARFGEKSALLCAVHAGHVRDCPECSRWVAAVEPR